VTFSRKASTHLALPLPIPCPKVKEHTTYEDVVNYLVKPL
jgi:hypothetical protein